MKKQTLGWRTVRRLVAAVAIPALGCVAAWGAEPADAKRAYDAGKEAFAAGNYERARELLASASQVDTLNPEVFLWLGRAHYELGELDEAMAAWASTLKLAPEQAYAKRMLAALRGHAGQADVMLSVVETLVGDGQFDAALAEAQKLINDKALTDVQRARALALRAEALVGAGRAKEVPAVVQEALARFPKAADAARLNLALGRAYVKMGGERTGEGLALLKKVAAENANTPQGAGAQLELITFDLEQGVTPERTDALAKWVDAHAAHPLANAARYRLVDVLLARAAAGAVDPNAGALAKGDADMLAAVGELYRHVVRADEAEKLTRRVIAFIDERFARTRAYGAAVGAVEQLLKAPLPRSSRALALRAGVRYRTEGALRDLTTALMMGNAPKADALPPALVSVVEAIELINREFPEAPAWREQAELAERVRAAGAATEWPAGGGGLKAPYAWAIKLALPVVKANADEAAVVLATTTVTNVVEEVAALRDPVRLPAAGIMVQLTAAMSVERPAWAQLMWRQVDLLDALAAGEFADNVRLGKGDANGKLSGAQQQLVATLQQLVGRQAGAGNRALGRLGGHLQPWLAAGQYKVAEEAYGQFAKGAADALQAQARLAVINLGISRVIQEHDRLVQAGLAPARELDADLKRALQDLYALQRNLKETDPLIGQVRRAWEVVIAHYKGLEYFDTAEQAINAKGEPAVAVADAYAQYQVARLKDELARRELDQLARRREGGAKLVLTPAFKGAIEAYQAFIAANATSTLAGPATEAVFAIARLYENRQAPEVAAEIFTGFAAFAGKVPVLAAGQPGVASVAERAAFAAADALESRARRAMAKAMEGRKPTAGPPDKLSDEWAAAIGAYREFVKARPQSVYLPAAIQKIQGVALEYARVDAWDVADKVFADLLASGLAIRNPERLEFSRGLCQLGKAMPEHAREVLQAMTFGARPAGDKDDPASVTASPTTRPTVATGQGHGGRQCGGGGGGSGGLVTGGGTMGIDRAGGEMADEDATRSDRAKAEGGAMPGGLTGALPKQDDVARLDGMALAAIRQREASQAARLAMMRDEKALANAPAEPGAPPPAITSTPRPMGPDGRPGRPAIPPLSDAELARQQGAIDAAYAIFNQIRAKHPTSVTAEQARGEVMVMAMHWREIGQWPRAAALVGLFLKDNPADAELPRLRLQIGRDYLSWAARPLDPAQMARQAMLAEVATRFDRARKELLGIIGAFPDEKAVVQEAQWDVANSWLVQARTVDAISPTLARAQYVRAAREMARAAGEFHEHPNIGQIPQTLWQIGTVLLSRGYHEEAITVWTDLVNFDPAGPLAQPAAQQIAQVYQVNLGRPLRAVETWIEINFARGGNDAAAQQAVFTIGHQLRDQSRWAEALHALETFVVSFPKNPNAGRALTMIGQVHQTNEAWAEAIAAYRRVLSDFPSGAWVQEARWAIAECTINLSRWRDGIAAYEEYARAYPNDPKLAEANRRIGVLKDLERYQILVDEPGQRKAFDAQNQIATIVRAQLANPQKAIIEFRKVAREYPTSHLADDALLAVGQIYLERHETQQARVALAAMAEKYPDSNLADDALFLIGKSYEEEAQQLAGLTRTVTEQQSKEIAQKQAYQQLSTARNEFKSRREQVVSGLKKAGKTAAAELEEARFAAQNLNSDQASVELAASAAERDVEALTAVQLADRGDKINAALRRAVEAYDKASKVPQADKAGDSLLRMSVIYDEQLHDSRAAVETWLEIVRQFSGTAVAEEASWRVAQYYERERRFVEAIEAYKAFLRNYRRSTRAAAAQFAIAENYEHLSKWVEAMDSYTNYLNNFPEGPLAGKAREQIGWIKQYRL